MTTEDEAQADALAHFDQQTNGAWLSWPDHQKEDAVADYVAGYLAGVASRVSTPPSEEVPANARWNIYDLGDGRETVQIRFERPVSAVPVPPTDAEGGARLARDASGPSQIVPSSVHFAPYGSTNAVCDETVPRSVHVDERTGEYGDERFTVKRDRTTCPECRWRMGLGPAPTEPEEKR